MWFQWAAFEIASPDRIRPVRLAALSRDPDGREKMKRRTEVAV